PSEEVHGVAVLPPRRTLTDVEALPKGAPLLDLVVPESHLGNAALSHLNRRMRARVIGTTPDFLEAGRFEIEHGRMICQLDLDQVHKVVVLGSTVVETLWPNEPGYNP